MIKDKIISVELLLESIREKDGRPIILVKALTKDFEEDYVLKMLAEASVGKHYIWRHRHPIDSKHTDNHIYGQVINSYVEDSLFSEIELFTHTNDHKSYLELLNERLKISEPLGLSMRYRKYYDNEKLEKVIHVDVFEESGTPFPKCEKCSTLKMGVINMANEDENEDEEDLLEISRKKIEALEKMLNEKSESFEKLKCDLKTLEKELSSKDESLEGSDSRIKKLEDTILEMGMEMEFLSIKKPIMDKILEVKELDKDELDFYKSKSVKYLEEKLEQWTKDAEKKIVTKTIRDSANEALKNKEKKKKPKYVIDGKEYTRDEAFERFTSDLNIEKKK